jgi:hypothetical protein
MARPKSSTTRTTLGRLNLPGKRIRGICTEIPKEASSTLDATKAIIDQLLGVTPALTIVLTRALEVYHDHLSNILNELNDPKHQASDTDLMELQALLEEERLALFNTAGRPNEYWNPKMGRLPSLESLIGMTWDRDRMVKNTVKGLKKLGTKIKGAANADATKK